MILHFIRYYIYPIATLVGGIIGVGFLSLPYVTLHVGTLPMLMYFAVMFCIVLSIHLIFGEIALRTPDFKRWPGFVEFYFGKPAKIGMLIMIMLGLFGVMLVYLIIGGEFLTETLQSRWGGNILSYTLLYWALGSLFILVGVKAIAKFDVIAIVILLLSFFIIFWKGLSHIAIENLFFAQPVFHLKNIFLPYGAILFALWGTGLIPEVEEMIRGQKRSLKSIIIASTVIPALIYILFTILTLSLTGPQTTESALIGIRNLLGNGIISFALFIGVITTFVAFLAQGLLLKKILTYDMGWNTALSSLVVCSTPMALFLLGFHSFIPIISLVGGVLLSIDGILILLIYQRMGGKKIYTYPLMIFFFIGIIYSISNFIS